MIRHLSEYINCLQRVHSKPLSRSNFERAGCTARELVVVDLLLLGQSLSDVKAERVFLSTSKSKGTSSYRKAITRLQQRLDGMVWNSLLASSTSGKHRIAIELFKHIVIGEVMSRVGSRLVAKRHLSQALRLSSSPDFIAHELLATNILLQLVSSEGDVRGTKSFVRHQADIVSEVELLQSLESTLATMRACGTKTPARAQKMELLANDARILVESLTASSSSARILTSVSRLATAIAQVEHDPRIALQALLAHRTACKRIGRWTEIDARDYYLQRAFVFQSLSSPKEAIAELRKAIPLLRPGTLQWFTASEALLDCLLKAGKFSRALLLSGELRTQSRFSSLPSGLRDRIIIRAQYAGTLAHGSQLGGSRRVPRIRGSSYDLHSMICRIIVARSKANWTQADELAESLARAVSRSTVYRRDRALVLLSRLLRTLTIKEYSLSTCRRSKRFTA